MSKLGTIFAVKKRRELIRKLGGKCAKCGSKSMLEIDHIYGRTWTPRNYSSDTRVRMYWKEYEAGLRAGKPLLQVLCKSCNVKKGGHEAPPPKWAREMLEAM